MWPHQHSSIIIIVVVDRTLRRNKHNDEDISFSSNEVPLPYQRLARRRSSSSTGSMIERRDEKSGSDNIEFKKVNIPSETPGELQGGFTARMLRGNH